MKIGYPCINRSIGCTANSTFRLKSYSEENLKEKLGNNLDCLDKILKYNAANGLLFFRISSDIVPFASHQINRMKWWQVFGDKFREIGNYIKENDIRIGMHPDQFTLINAKDPGIVKRSVSELKYHARVLDTLRLDDTAKIQIHVGGVYGDKDASIARFSREYKRLPASIKRRLVIENDDVSYSAKDCLEVNRLTGVPLLFDTFHHEVKNSGESLTETFRKFRLTWKKKDGIPMIDYSSQKKDARKGTHAVSLDVRHFKRTISQLQGDFDIMLEIKDKENSAMKALKAIR